MFIEGIIGGIAFYGGIYLMAYHAKKVEKRNAYMQCKDREMRERLRATDPDDYLKIVNKQIKNIP